MAMKTAILAAAALVALALVRAGASGAAEEGPYPIWWSPLLELESLDGIDARLDRETWPGANDFMVYKEVGGERIGAIMDTCAKTIELSDGAYEAPGNNNHQIQLRATAWCRTIAAIKHAQPAKQSFVRNFKLDQSALNVLPIIAHIGPSCYGQCWNLAGNEKKISWKHLRDYYTVEESGKNEIKVGDKIDRYRFQLLAQADFNADGLEDIVLMVDYYTTEGTYGTTHMFILTRDSSDGVFWAPDPDRYLCPNYECRGPYDLPKDAP
jgi:hypothetical protein